MFSLKGIIRKPRKSLCIESHPRHTNAISILHLQRVQKSWFARSHWLIAGSNTEQHAEQQQQQQ